jgi:Peptidase family C25/CARDB
MRKVFTLILLLSAFASRAQVYNNEWIDYNKTYYKFKVGSNGLFRIPSTSLSAIGLSSTPAEHFQLWRNGKQVALFTSASSGPLGGAGYIEFWGRMNDGEADKTLYREQESQHTDKWSLQTDTAAYFLTVNPAGGNLRIATVTNNVAGNSLPAEPYFMHTMGKYYKDRVNTGFAAVVGEYVYSSSYDKGEFWSSQDITPFTPSQITFNNLAPYTGLGAPDASFKLGVSGNALNPRQVVARINGAEVVNTTMDLFTDSVFTRFGISLTGIGVAATGSAIVVIKDSSYVPTDRMVASFYELNYPRQFNFGGEKNFTFKLPANSNGNYLEITNFNNNGIPPVLYDLTNNKRYIGELSGGSIKFALEPSVQERMMVLSSLDAGNISTVSNLVTRNFVNYSATANQGDFLIITNPILYTSSTGTNPVNEYRDYRASTAGGGYNVKVIEMSQLIDQFGLGIKQHPNSIRYFLRFARNAFIQKPKFVLLIGRGLSYNEYVTHESNPLVERLNLVPTFGYPASDILLSAEDLTYAVPATPIGRISAITGDELRIYLNKLKEYELAQANPSCSISDKGWMKNIVHVIGASDENLRLIIEDYMRNYSGVIKDTLFGAKITSFSNSSSNSVQQLSSDELERLFAEGLSLITYFGHSSASTLEFNLDDPQKYNNPGKYPVFLVNGCNAGNFFTFNPDRLNSNESLSEKYVLSKNRGGIGFIASTHFGIVNYLNIYCTGLYDRIARQDYGKPLGIIMKDAINDMYNVTAPDDYYARMHGEQTTLNGDPAVRLNSHLTPDYVIEDPMVRISPSFISIAEEKFNVKAYFRNNGRAIDDSIFVEVKRQYPDGSSTRIIKQKIAGIRYIDSISLEIPIVPTRDKGLNKITVTIDADNNVNEGSCENNNTVTKDVFIFEDELRPTYPYNYSITNKTSLKLLASTANPLGTPKLYVMEMDTTEQFNSSLKITRQVTTSGGIVEFDPGTSFLDSTVYYWRTAPVPSVGDFRWNNSSFLFLRNTGSSGYNQSHYFQHLKSGTERISLTGDRRWKYNDVVNNLFIRSGTWITSTTQEAEMSVAVNGEPYIRNACQFSTLVYNVFDPVTFKPIPNETNPVTNEGLYGSWKNDCFPGREFNFEYRYVDTGGRRRAMNFMDNVIKDGAYVVVRGFVIDTNAIRGWPQATAADWKKDTMHLGSNNSIYHRLYNAGFTQLDSFNKIRSWIFVYKKNDPSFTPRYIFSQGTSDKITLSVDCRTPDTLGFITSPKFGPAKTWKELKWRGNASAADSGPGDYPLLDVIGINLAGQDTLLYTLDQSQQDFDISAVSATQYPYMKLRMKNQDSLFLTPYQLRYWRVLFDPIPEGAIAANILYKGKDTLEAGEILDFAVAFKNISDVAFADSLKTKLTIIDKNFVSNNIPLPKKKALISGDTLTVVYSLDTRNFTGNNTLFLDINPDNDQPEQYHFNNFLYKEFYVKPDNQNPLLDVTFDGTHILNRDIVSPKPHIIIKLKDEARFLPLNDTALFDLKIKFPDNTIRKYRFDNDTLKFTPANLSGGTGDNTASLDLTPYFPKDGDYELSVTGKDRSGNKAGALDYLVSFRVFNKPMISNLLNYPNPFTSSTAFVFTITGTEIPQGLKIQILTVTGKVVREITQAELGPLRIGRNITQFKWDGTDQYGQALGNGVYLYRVVTSLNGQRMEKFTDKKDDTDKYFNRGYGKMYLMR